MRKHPIAFTQPAALLAAFIAVWPAAAQSPAGAFAGKTVNLIIGFGTGGGYDLWARVVARHIGRNRTDSLYIRGIFPSRRRTLSRLR